MQSRPRQEWKIKRLIVVPYIRVKVITGIHRCPLLLYGPSHYRLNFLITCFNSWTWGVWVQFWTLEETNQGRQFHTFEKYHHMKKSSNHSIILLRSYTSEFMMEFVWQAANIFPHIVVGCRLQYLGGEHWKPCWGLLHVWDLSTNKHWPMQWTWLYCIVMNWISNCRNKRLLATIIKHVLITVWQLIFFVVVLVVLTDGCVACNCKKMPQTKLTPSVVNSSNMDWMFMQFLMQRWFLHVLASWAPVEQMIAKHSSSCSKLIKWLQSITNEINLLEESAYPPFVNLINDSLLLDHFSYVGQRI